jgi:PBSX family phage terminase large subunit
MKGEFRKTEKQILAAKLLASRDFTRYLFDGGARSGKTVKILEYLVDRSYQFPGCRQLIARKHRNHVEDSIWRDTLPKFLTRVPRRDYTLSEKHLTLKFRNSSEIWLGGLDDDERVEKILGTEFLTAFLDEGTQISWETVQMVITRLAQVCLHAKTGRPGVNKLLLACNPRGPRHWLHRVGVEHVDPDTLKPLRDAARWCRLHWSAYDNRANLPPAFMEALEALPDVRRDRMLNGIWRDNEGAVYDEFDEDTHVVEPFEIPRDWQRVRGIDFGYTNPFVCLWGALDHDGRLFIYREHYESQKRIPEHAEVINRFQEPVEWTVADHDAEDRAELEYQGIPTLAAKKEVEAGIKAVKNRLVVQGDGRPRLFIFKTCTATLGEFYEYQWEPPKDGKNAKEAPLKVKDHAMDPLRYIAMELANPRESGAAAVSDIEKREKRLWESY